ncbi:MAG: hypothetical protein HUJ68_11115, partial [Clostridia bacterium]|nr:hypothetical protein [Clostridia bacterium]
MKRIIVLSLFLFCSNSLFSYDLFGSYELDPGHEILLNSNGTGKIFSLDEDELLFYYSTGNEGQLDFLYFLNEGIKYNDDKVKRVLLLLGKEENVENERSIAFGYYNKDSWFIRDVPRTMEGYCEYKDCTSYLKEGQKEYTIDNLSEIRIDSPWVEGVSGNGEGEGFTIVGNAPFLLIVNGFISVKKP